MALAPIVSHAAQPPQSPMPIGAEGSAHGMEAVKPKFRSPKELMPYIAPTVAPETDEVNDFQQFVSGASSFAPEIQVDPHGKPDGKGHPGPLAPTFTGISFQGIGYTGAIPPDPAIAVGRNNIVEVTNFDWAIYDLKGNQQYRVNFNTWFGNSDFYFDPKVIYDPFSDRFVIVELHRHDSTHSSWWTVMVSVDGNPNDGFWYYDFDARVDGGTDVDQWVDYPYIGYDSQAIYLTGTMFPWVSGTTKAKIRILSKSQLYAAASAGWWDFWGLSSNGSSDFFLAPAEQNTEPGQHFIVNSKNGGGSTITLRRITNPVGWASGGSGPGMTTEVINVGGYSVGPTARQPSGLTPIETIDARIFTAAYANGHLVFAQTCGYDWGDGTGARDALKVYEFNIYNNPATVTHDRIFGAGGLDYFEPAVMTTTGGDTTYVFTRSGASEYPSARMTAWRTTDADIEGSAYVKQGEGTYVNTYQGRNRWGDYLAAKLDPFDNQTIWVVGEYATSSGYTWSTWIAETNFKPTTSISVPTVYGAIGQTVSLSATLAPALNGQTLQFAVSGASAGSTTTNSSGVAAVNYYIDPSLGTGSKTIGVTYDRTYSYNRSYGSGTLSVSQASTALYVYSEYAHIHDNLYLYAYLYRLTDYNGVAGAYVELYVDGNYVGYGFTDSSGFVYPLFYVPTAYNGKTKSIQAIFYGDNLHYSSSGANSLFVYDTPGKIGPGGKK